MELIIALLISLGIINAPEDFNSNVLEQNIEVIENNGIIVDDIDNN